jgi:hypothetical protein
MVNKLFTDEKGIQMECYVNLERNCIIKVGDFDDIMRYQWIELNDIDDIDELIKELRIVKKQMILASK